MEKVIRDGKVAVLYVAQYGGGWSSSFNNREEKLYKETLMFSPRLVAWAESEKIRVAR